jgi:hypothetical protein
VVKNRDSSELAARNTPVRDKKTGVIGTLQIGAGFTLSTTQDNNVTQYDKNRIKQRGSRDKAATKPGKTGQTGHPIREHF